MAVKPWLGAIKAPSNYIKSNDNMKKPNMSVNLEYVHGYRSKDCRNNIFFNNDRLIYFAAGVGIRLNYENNTQKFFKKHRDDIISMDYSKEIGKFATGEIGPKPRVFIWNPNDMSGDVV